MPAVKGDSSDAQVAGVQATNTATDGTGLLAISDHGIGLEVRGGERAALFKGEVDLITSSLCVMRPVLFPGSPGHPPKVGEPIKVSELGKDGGLILRDQGGRETITLSVDHYSVAVRNKDDQPDKQAIWLDAGYYSLILRNKGGSDSIWIHADPSNGGSGIDLRDQKGTGAITLSADTNELVLRNKGGGDSVWIHGDPANGGSGIDLRDQKGTGAITLSADTNALVLRNKGGGDSVWIHGDPANGGSGIDLRNQSGSTTIQIDGDQGDIRLVNADCAEEFEVAHAEPGEPGTVMVLNEDGQLVHSAQPYDKRVVGVVSGVGDLRPGLVLGRQPEKSHRLPIALIGRVYCKVDADLGPVDIGDLLTTSTTSGHAMKASDAVQAFGAVIGKALRPLARGRGLVPILVALQ